MSRMKDALEESGRSLPRGRAIAADARAGAGDRGGRAGRSCGLSVRELFTAPFDQPFRSRPQRISGRTSPTCKPNCPCMEVRCRHW